MDKSTVVPTLFATLAITIWCCSWTGTADGARIIAIEMAPAKSHWNFMSGVLRSLTDAGHHVTVFTSFVGGERENYVEVDMSGVLPRMVNNDTLDSIEQFSHPLWSIRIGAKISRDLCNGMYENERLQNILDTGTDSGFDAIIIEPLWNDCVSYIAHILGVPIIYAIPSPLTTFMEFEFIGQISNPAFVPHSFGIGAVPGGTTFVRRLSNVIQLVYTTVFNEYNKLSLRMAGPKPYDYAPTVNPSVVFLNNHFLVESSRPIPPNVVDIGGIHLCPANVIPKEIIKFMEESPNGVIYFTFGSLVKFSKLPEQILKTFKEVLSRVPQRVLWKYEEDMEDKPENVMISKWFPQREILLHPNVKLFISHGGMSGVFEAVDAGVPVLGFPLFFDQHRNIGHLVYNGMSISMDLFTMNADELFNAISELINNEKYLRNAKVNSELFKDRPMTPQQSVVYWTEYVIRHKGAPHLRSNGYNLTWYQYLLLDVIFVAFVFIFLCLIVTRKVFKFVYKLVL